MRHYYFLFVWIPVMCVYVFSRQESQPCNFSNREPCVRVKTNSYNYKPLNKPPNAQEKLRHLFIYNLNEQHYASITVTSAYGYIVHDQFLQL